MKAKKLVLSLAAVFAATALAACGNNSKMVAFLDYWKYNPNTAEAVNELAEYDVTFERGAGYTSLGYALSYANGKYVTHLTNAESDYVYTTSLTIDVTYQYGSEEAKTFTDVVTSVTRFSKASLQPIASEKSVLSHTPTTSATTTDNCYVTYEYTVATTYDGAGNASSTVTDTSNAEAASTIASTFEYGKNDYTYVDNEQLLLAMRALSPSTSSGSLETYNPFSKQLQKVDFTFTTSEEAAGKNFTYTHNGVLQENKPISCRTASLTLDSQNPGTTQTATIATTADDATKNVNRNMLLRLEAPTAYNIGQLVYTLNNYTVV